MEHLTELLGKLDIPPAELARIAETAKTDPMAAMGLLNDYLTPETLQELLAIFLGNPAALAQMAEEAGVSAEELANLREQFGDLEAP